MADDVGSMLLRAGLVAPENLEAARSEAELQGGTIPEALVYMGFIADEELTAFYRNRLLIPRINPSELTKLRPLVLEAVPPDMAAEFRAIPISKEADGTLTLVMSDPSNSRAVDEIGYFTQAYIVRAIATQEQIAWCLAHYYKLKTALFSKLVDEGRWPDARDSKPIRKISAEISAPQAEASEKETAPMATRPAKKKPKSSLKGATRELVRPKNQQPSPPELFARAGEIDVISRPARKVDSAPEVIVNMDWDDEGQARPVTREASGVIIDEQRGTDTAPFVLTHRHEASEAGAIILGNSRRRRRTSKRTAVGVPPADGSAVDAAVDAAVRATVEAAEDALDDFDPQSVTPRSTDLVGPQWGQPGTTIPPGFLGASKEAVAGVSDAIPETIQDEEVTSKRVAEVESIPVPVDDEHTVRSAVPHPARQNHLSDSASRLLQSLRKIDSATNKSEVIEPLLSFLDRAFARTGFLALKQDDLVAWSLRGIDGRPKTPNIAIDDDSTWRDVVRMRLPYNGPVEDAPTRALAASLQLADARDLLALPLSVRERVVGVLFGLGSYDSVYEEHITVLSQAASEALERLVLAKKR